MAWEKVKLGDVCKSITDGDHQSLPLSECGIPFIVIANISSNNRIEFEKTRYVPLDYYEKLDEKRKPQKGDVLLTVKGSFGIPVFVANDKPFVFQRDIAILKCGEKVNPKFLFFYMKNKDFYLYTDSIAIGAAQRAITLNALRNTIIRLPQLNVQNRIADILSAYDDLIENNQKQIKLLEEAAQRLYKQWFIDLKFPGHETTKIVDGLPEGWKKKIVMDFISQEIGGGWGEDDIDQKSSRPAFVIRGADIDGVNHGDFLNIPFRFHSESNLEQRILQDGDIVFEVSGGSKTEGVAKTLLITTRLLEQYSSPVICASFCKKIRPKEGLSQYFYDALQYMRMSGVTSEYDKKSASSIVNYRWKDFLSQQCLMLPSENILRMYDKIAKPIYKSIQTKSIEIEKLKRARNSLLPKLMSGEIEV